MICVVGEALVDVFIDPGGDPHEAVGGSPLNLAVALARLDVPTQLISQIGADERGARVTAQVLESGVELLSAPTVSGRTATATVTLDTHGSASYDFDIDWTLGHQELPECDALHVGSLGALIEPGRDTVVDLVEQAWARDVFVSYDPNVRAEFLDDPAQVWGDIQTIGERSGLVKLSTEDVELLHPGADAGDIARSVLAGERTEVVLLTRGDAGATAYVEGLAVDVPACAVEVVDTVGAGDAFTAGALTILLESGAMGSYGPGVPNDEAGLLRLLRGASEIAAITCSRRGADPPLRGDLSLDWPN